RVRRGVHRRDEAVEVAVEVVYEADVGLGAQRVEAEAEDGGVSADGVFAQPEGGEGAAEGRLVGDGRGRRRGGVEGVGEPAGALRLCADERFEGVELARSGEVEGVAFEEAEVVAELHAAEVRLARSRPAEREGAGDERLGEGLRRREAVAPDGDVHRALGPDGRLQPMQRLHARVALRQEVREVGVDAEGGGLAEGQRRQPAGHEEHEERVPDSEAEERAEDVEQRSRGRGGRATGGALSGSPTGALALAAVSRETAPRPFPTPVVLYRPERVEIAAGRRRSRPYQARIPRLGCLS